MDWQASVDALRATTDTLRPTLRPSPVGTAPLPWRRHAAVVALEALDGRARLAAVESLLEDDDPLCVAVATHLLFAGRPQLERRASRDANAPGGATGPAAPQLDPAGVDRALDRALTRALDFDDEILDTMVVAAIGRLGAVRHLEHLRGALDRPATFWAAVESLALIGGDDVLEDLQRAIDRHVDHWDKLDVVVVIGDVGGRFARPILTRILEDQSLGFTPLRGYAAQALGARGDHGALPALIGALDDPTMDEKGRVLWGIAQLARSDVEQPANRAPRGTEQPANRAPRRTPVATPEAVLDPVRRGRMIWDAVEPFVRPDAPKRWWRAEALKALAGADPERAAPIAHDLLETDAFFRDDAEAFSDALRALGTVAERAEPATAALARRHLVEALRANIGLDTDPHVLIVPAWVADAGPRLAAVALTQLGRAYGPDLQPRTSNRTARQEVVHQAARLRATLSGEPRLLAALDAVVAGRGVD